MDLITTHTQKPLLPLPMAVVTNDADQSCPLWILFYLDLYDTQYLNLCLLCRFLSILLSQVMGDTQG